MFFQKHRTYLLNLPGRPTPWCELETNDVMGLTIAIGAGILLVEKFSLFSAAIVGTRKVRRLSSSLFDSTIVESREGVSCADKITVESNGDWASFFDRIIVESKGDGAFVGINSCAGAAEGPRTMVASKAEASSTE